MSSFQTLFKFSKDLNTICSRMRTLTTKTVTIRDFLRPRNQLPVMSSVSQFHTTSTRHDLMEFFDDKKNWGQNEIKCGRAWTTDELRLKSNTDLHKLWYVLLKEQNMLLTMEHECDVKNKLFPNPERIDKVKMGMSSIETVVRERNRAYHMLETGLDGERPGKVVHNQLGLKFFYRETEHFIPKQINTKWKKTHIHHFDEKEVSHNLKMFREKLYNVKRKAKNRDHNEVVHLLRRFPNVSKDLLARKYPQVDLRKIVREDKARGHFAPK